MFVKEVKKLICILSVSTFLMGTYALPSFAINSQTPIKLTDQQKKDALNQINNNTIFRQKYGKIDVSKATNEEFKEYGIPERPTDPEELKQWNRLYGSIKETIKPQFAFSDTSGISWPSSWPNGTIAANKIESGAFNRDDNLNVGFNPIGYQNVIGEFTVPDLTKYKDNTNTTAKVMFWAGIGGANPNPPGHDSLIQDGVEADFANNSASYHAFWEDACSIPGNYYNNSGVPGSSNAAYITSLKINSNDVIDVGVGLSGSGGSTMNFQITDWTTGQSTSFSEQTKVPTATDPNPVAAINNNCAEWFTEAPTLLPSGNISPLADYGTENWLGCYSYGPLGAAKTESGMVANPFTGASDVKGINMFKNNILESSTSNPTFYNTFTTTWNAP
ncbi:MAG: hypothetical protein P4L59_02410 [Desulfosporosinus sp.]|nr:hypothetical protein [Desulfosporosinus sp.]